MNSSQRHELGSAYLTPQRLHIRGWPTRRSLHVTAIEQSADSQLTISPIVANVYLHEVLDLWFEREVKPRLQGDAGAPGSPGPPDPDCRSALTLLL